MEETLRQRWNEYRPSKTQTFWIAAGCIVATLILGFGPGGWVSGATAAQMVTDASQKSRQELAVAICVDKFMHAENASAQLAKVKEAGWYDRGGLVAAGGWATMPDKTEPNSTVASMCASQLAERSEAGGGKQVSAN